MRTPAPGRPRLSRRRPSTLALGLVLAVAGSALSGCSTDASRPAAVGATAQHVGAVTAPALTTTADVGRIVGRLPGTRRKAVRKEITQVVDRWWDAAYLDDVGTDMDVSAAFPGFTPGARRRATFDRELMTHGDVDAASITPVMRKVRLDLLAVDRRVRSVTVRFDLRTRVRATTGRGGRLQVRGRLFLTRRADDWRIFGYDVSKGWL